MSVKDTVSFQEAIDLVDSLAEYQQEDLIDIIRHRIIERRQGVLVENIKEARDEFERGEVKKGTIDDLMRELSE